MRTSKMIKFLLVTFSLVTWAGYSSVNASEYLDGMDDILKFFLNPSNRLLVHQSVLLPYECNRNNWVYNDSYFPILD